jgi:hypothetical protein
MAIQGDLKEFTIPELFQFMQQHSKNGCLYIRGDRQELVIYFQEGRIEGVCPKGQAPEEFWCEILSKTGYLSEDKEKRLRKRKTYDLAGFREILVREGIVSDEELEELLQRQSQELLLRVLKLKKGSFFFSTAEKAPVDIKLSEPIFVEAFLLDGLRMLDEWPIIRKRIGSFQSIPYRQFRTITSFDEESEKVPRLGLWSKVLNVLGVHSRKGAIDDMSFDAEASLSPVEIEIYRRINGKRSIQQIIDESVMGEYSVCKALLSLLEGGWIERASPVRSENGSERRVAKTRNRFLEGFYFLLLLISVSILIYGIATGEWKKDIFWNRFPQGRDTLIYRYLNQQRREKVVHALEMFAREHGEYPQTLGVLVGKRFLEESEIHVLGRNSYSYTSLGKQGYHLIIVPEDGVSRTGNKHGKYTSRNHF